MTKRCSKKYYQTNEIFWKAIITVNLDFADHIIHTGRVIFSCRYSKLKWWRDAGLSSSNTLTVSPNLRISRLLLPMFLFLIFRSKAPSWTCLSLTHWLTNERTFTSVKAKLLYHNGYMYHILIIFLFSISLLPRTKNVFLYCTDTGLYS